MSKNLNQFEIEYLAKKRISKIFKINIKNLSPDFIFGQDLTPSFISDWKQNEIDDVIEDINFIVSRSIKIELGKDFKLNTVEDYCNFMIKSYYKNPKRVLKILLE